MFLNGLKLAAAAYMFAFAGYAAGQTSTDAAIRLITPYPPGGSTTTLARLVAQKLSEVSNQPVIVDNRPGGNTVIGYEAVLKSRPDGQTLLLMAQTPHVFFPLAVPNLPFDEVKDFAPVATLASSEFVLVVHPSVSANSLKELIALAKSRPGRLNFASSGTGTTAHLATEYFNILASVRMQHVPYKGSGPALADLLGGQVDAFLSPPSVVAPHVMSGKLRALAVSGERRLTSLPDVPTFSEAGLPGFDVKIWYGVLVPAATPKTTIEKLSAQIGRVMKLPDVQESLGKQGMEPFVTTPEEFARVIEADRTRFGKIIRTANIKFDK